MALLCNVSEAIHMLHGVLQCRQEGEPIISICDSGGKSNLVFGLASLLNLLLYPRLHSRNLKHVLLEQRDGTKAYLPGWMIKPAVAHLKPVVIPRIDVVALEDLRRLLDHLLSSLAFRSAGNTARGGKDDTGEQAPKRSVSRHEPIGAPAT
ncbi:MAG: Tn3 family transposase [Gammaproteobacteria bacterium]